jgi:hypothetical protein
MVSFTTSLNNVKLLRRSTVCFTFASKFKNDAMDNNRKKKKDTKDIILHYITIKVHHHDKIVFSSSLMNDASFLDLMNIRLLIFLYHDRDNRTKKKNCKA